MDETTLKTMPEYIQKLPKVVQDFIFEKAWQERTEEIAKKYSLSTDQTNLLVDNVLFVLLGLDTGEDFIKQLPSELGISNLLSGQILEELETRVFDYSVKSIQNRSVKNETPEPPPIPEYKKLDMEALIPDPKRPVPEVRPSILPAVEENEKVNILEPKTAVSVKTEAKNIFDVPKKLNEVSKPTTNPGVSRINYRPREVVEEKISTPVPVPRFNAIVEKEIVTELPKQQTTQPKPTGLTQPPIKTTASPKTEITKPEHKYAVDPYREPIE